MALGELTVLIGGVWTRRRHVTGFIESLRLPLVKPPSASVQVLA